MYTRHIFLILLLAPSITGCSIFPTAIPSVTSSPTHIISTKAPEPTGSMIGGEISGVLDNTLVYIRVFLPDGWQQSWGTRSGNGPWQGDVAGTNGLDCTITADAEGFVCTPASYSVRSVGLSAYLVEDGVLTDIEALHLDFHCEPIGTPAPASGG